MLAAVAAACLVGAAPVARSGSPRPVRFTVLASGDIMMHGPVTSRALGYGSGRRYTFRPMFARIRRYVAGADLAICHLEAPFLHSRPHGYPRFSAPPSLAFDVKATGWDLCSAASNHALDQGVRGIAATRRYLSRAGVGFSGVYTSPRQRRWAMTTVRGVRVAFLAYTEMTNGIPLPHGWSVGLARAGRIVADARRARHAGARAVIVNLHWGDEYHSAPSAFQRALSVRLARSHAITAVVGQHVHVVQPVRFIRGTPFVFGEGNLVSNQMVGNTGVVATQDGLMALLDFVADRRGVRVVRVRYMPTWVHHPDFRVLPVGDALRAHLASRRTLRASYARTVGRAGRGSRVAPVPAHLP